MYEVPDWEEIYGTDPNDASHIGPGRGSAPAPAVVTGPKANRWFVVARTVDEPKNFNLALKIDDGEMFWWRPNREAKDVSSRITVFTDIREADKAMLAAQEKFPEFTVWVTGYTVKE